MNMRPKVKRTNQIIVILLLLTVALSVLGGCSSSNTPTSAPAETTASSEPAKTSAESDESAEEDVATDELLGEWIDIDTASVLTLTEEGDAEFVGSQTGSGFWKTAENGIAVGAGSVNLEDVLQPTEENGAISLIGGPWHFVRPSDLPMQEFTIGETGEDDTISVTLVDVQFVDSLPLEIYNKVKSMGREYGEETILGEGQVYACVTYTIQNVSKSTITLGDHDHCLEIALDYDDGYIYSTEDESADYFVASSSDLSVYYKDVGTDAIEIQALSSKTINTYIRCPERVGSNEAAQLDVIFLSLYNPSVQYYRFNVRPGA